MSFTKTDNSQEIVFDVFQRFYIINLPSRSDRLQAVLSDLARAGIDANEISFNIPVGAK